MSAHRKDCALFTDNLLTLIPHHFEGNERNPSERSLIELVSLYRDSSTADISRANVTDENRKFLTRDSRCAKIALRLHRS